MKGGCFRVLGLRLLLTLILAAAGDLYAQKLWINPTSGFWTDTNSWSGRSAPTDTSAAVITNANTKTVTIDATTPLDNLTIASLAISAPSGFTNSLLLTDIGTNNPLLLLNGLISSNGGLVRVTNSALTVDPSVSFIRLDGRFVLDSGLVAFGGLSSTTKVGQVTSGVLTINSGSVSAGRLKVGADTAGANGVITMAGGSLDIASEFSVGRDLGTTGTVSMVGGLLIATNGDVRVGDAGVGTMTISNATALLTNLTVGHTNLAVGAFTIRSGAVVQVFDDINVGRLAGATGTVVVAGGQLLAPAQTLYIGRDGQGQMTVSNGAIVTVSSLEITNTGTFSFSSGTLNVQNANIANGHPFVVGDGVAPATLNMTGGTLTFANGLTISSHAALTGCGTIIGPIANFGTINTNCGPALVRPTITSQARAGIANIISFTSVSGQTYFLEYKNSLTDATWSAIAPSVSGNGSVMTVTDLVTTAQLRLYRVRTQ